MSQEIEAIFDGKTLKPTQPLNLAAHTKVRLIIEKVLPNEPTPKTFLQTAKSLQLKGKADWSENIDKCLYLI